MESHVYLLVLTASSFVFAVEDNKRFDCLPGLKGDAKICQRRGCTWMNPSTNVVGIVIRYTISLIREFVQHGSKTAALEIYISSATLYLVTIYFQNENM